MATYVVGAKYESDSGTIHPLRVQQATYDAAGTPPTGDINSNIKAQIGKTNKEFGLRPRGANLARTIGTGDSAFVKYKFLPILTAAQFGTGSFTLGSTVTVDSVTWTIISLKAEDY